MDIAIAATVVCPVQGAGLDIASTLALPQLSVWYLLLVGNMRELGIGFLGFSGILGFWTSDASALVRLQALPWLHEASPTAHIPPVWKDFLDSGSPKFLCQYAMLLLDRGFL